MTTAVTLTDSLNYCLKNVCEFRERIKLHYFLKASERRLNLLNAIRTLHKENQLSPTRSEICKKLDLSSVELLWRDIDALECTNYLTVYKGNGRKTKSRNMVPKSVYKVPVFLVDNSGQAEMEIKVDIRLFTEPPHYAIKLTKHVEGVGGEGTMVFINAPVFLKKGRATIVENSGDTFSFINKHTETPSKPKFKSLLGGVVVGTISPLN
ncbi:hypothetical protein F0267_00270 [Vibrio coralliilyticus]|uniref:Uncharacterized protein n=1 Tax=Vibrio coralliilyticus TaxID=190893 RepID=A0AAN0SH67_9VIBR|nr:hypothetical protein [Vibrio coralliilyticus]AIW22554.1 hypothetical protein IX92_26185 [Vibrio coralliilyticus]NOH36653.1 hypothetical protein [Vibrio coralliilyticus]